MRIPCSKCGENAVVIGRPKNLEHSVVSESCAEQIGRIYLVCRACRWTGHADWITRMKAPEPVEQEQKPYFDLASTATG
jgi:hypothetical protein